MDLREFFTAIWPSQGHYGLATPIKDAEGKTVGYRHHVATTIAETLIKVDQLREFVDLFFTVHTLVKDRVFNPTKINYATKQPGAWEWRTHGNMSHGRDLFLDLDVGIEDKKTPRYATREEALESLERFCFRTHLPFPLLISSGGGYHAHWRLADDMLSADWRVLATRFYHVVKKFGMKVDPARTTDQSSVMRVPGTYNFKPKLKTRQPVTQLTDGVEMENADIAARLDELIGADVVAEYRGGTGQVSGHAILGHQGQIEYDGPITDITQLIEGCERVREYVLTDGNVPEPYWYVMGGVIPFARDGENLFQGFSKGHPGYNFNETARKMFQWKARSGPASCKKVDQDCGGDACQRCPLLALESNPLAATRKADNLKPTPVVTLQLASAPAPLVIVEPPYPYARVKSGISVTKKGEDGEPDEVSILCDYDMYPIEAYTKTGVERSKSVWNAVLPHVGDHQFEIGAVELSDSNALMLKMVDEGIYIKPSLLSPMRSFMLAYIKKLQQAQLAAKQHERLGWTSNKQEFVMGTHMLQPNKPPRPCVLSSIATNATEYMTKAGTLNRQVELMKFYDEPRYIRSQFVIGCALAAPLMAFTTHYGAILNLIGQSGGTKSLTMSTALSQYGHPTHMMINGAKSSNTVNSMNTRLVTIANIPMGIDEIGMMLDDDSKQLAILVSQQVKDKGRVGRTGTPKARRDESESTSLVLATSNTSLYQKVRANNDGGTAASMRIFEIAFPVLPHDPIAKGHAEDFFTELMLNHGHIGEVFVQEVIDKLTYYTQHVSDYLKSVDIKLNLGPPERFQGLIATMGLMGLEIGNKLGLLPYDIRPVRKWLAEEQMPFIRGHIEEQRAAIEPLTVMTNYLEHINGDMILTTKPAGSQFVATMRAPRGMMAGHFDVDEKVIWIRKDEFKAYCDRHHRDSSEIIRELSRSGVIANSDIKKSLGEGTEYAKSRSTCMMLRLTHPDLAGVASAASGPATNVVPITPNLARKRP